MGKRTLTLVVLACTATTAYLVGISLLEGDQIRFERAVKPGMSSQEVKAAVGIPDELLHPMEQLAKWGNEESRPVTIESWVYYVWPRSQHRMVLEFSDGKLMSLRHDQN